MTDLLHTAEVDNASGGLLMARPDLVATADLQDAKQWTVKDPISQGYFRLSEQQWYLLQCFDGNSRLTDIQRQYQAQYAPQRISPEALLGFAARLHEQGLLIANAPGQGQVLLERRRVGEKRRRFGSFLSVLSFRLPGFDPQSILDFLLPSARLLFHPAAVVLLAILGLLAAALLAGRMSVVLDRVPQLDDFLHRTNFMWLMVVFVLVKVCHELGHGLACRYYGAECRDMGVMLLAFMPCLYCDVTDAWTIRNKWHRVVVSAAGMYVELWIAVLCSYLWYFSEPGFLNALLFNVIVVCTVVTVLFNVNPLLRYDGYFILSDLVNVSNLGERASRALIAPLSHWLIPALPVKERNKPVLALYALLAVIYRTVAVIVIMWAFYKFLKSNRLQPLGDLLVMSTFVTLAIAPTLKFWSTLKHPSIRRLVRWGRVAALLTVIIGGIAAILLCPLPHTVKASATFESINAVQVFAPLSGMLHARTTFGQKIGKGETIATLTNQEFQLEQSRLEAEVSELKLSLQGLKSRIEQEPNLASLLPPTQSALERAQQQASLGRVKLSKLMIKAPESGTVLPPHYRYAPQSSKHDLSSWVGFALAPENDNCIVEAGDLLCLVQITPDLEAVLLVEQGDMEFVCVGQKVRLYLDESPTTTWYGKVIEISREEVAEVTRELADSGDVAVRADKQGSPELVETSYFVRVMLDDQPDGVRHGSPGLGKIEIGDRAIGQLLWRVLQTTFRFRL